MLNTFLTAWWRSLAMVNYRVDAAVVEPWLPHGLELDFFAGKTYVSLVGFLFLDTRLWGLPVPFHRNFEEVNLRFYVRRRVAGEVRRGVVFVKEIVPRAAIAWTARTFYNERYVALPMRHEVSNERARYEWRLGAERHSLGVGFAGEPDYAAEGSEAQFITEHYWGYAAQRDGGTVEYRVEHPPWRLWEGRDVRVEVDVAGLYGEAFVEALGREPTSAFVAEGSATAVHWPRRI